MGASDNTMVNNIALAREISFPWGMPGLEYKTYILVSTAEESPFFFLQSVEEPDIGLLLINPFTVFSDYEFDLAEEVLKQLEISNNCQVAVFCTVNTSRGIESATVNLLAPIVINTEKLLAKQVVFNEKKYSLRTPLAIRRRE